jgi:hypothetical protein
LTIGTCVLLAVIALADGAIDWGIAHGVGVAYTTSAGDCSGVCLFSSGYRIFRADHRPGPARGWEMIRYPWRTKVFNPQWHANGLLGFGSEAWSYDGDYEWPFPPPGTPIMHVAAFWVPHWSVQCLAWSPVLIAGFLGYRRRVRRRGRRSHGLCVTCGYDLRAHKLGGRCPECGTVIAEAPTARK